MKSESPNNPISPDRHPNLHGNPNAAPRCGARGRHTPSCNQPAMPNGRCRLHGGKSTGPRTFEGLERMRKAKITHGARTAEMEQVRKMIRDLKAGAKRLAERV
jgi:hypothetical protein